MLSRSVMTIHTLQEHTLVVYIKQRVFNFHFAQTHLCAKCHFVGTLFVLLNDAQGIKVGQFGTPQCSISHIKVYICLNLCPTYLQVYALFLYLSSLRVKEFCHERFATAQIVAIIQRKCYIHFCRGYVVRIKLNICSHIMVAHSYARSVIEVYFAENTAHAEHILAFQVRAITPTEHLHS